ncbi:Winged helix DNA-binding domain-containing protein [Quadrisphaera granulorum]|uniref:Winged helix DNA-binding protein n=1 Tax=Quadrisphaera granulorum TaxID=317664 RepID=A0A315ZW19_9ACTN|nr:winged helix DNA-binding protein [Quadrisphaera granulorum]PWJ48804.1 winged helix DNA-binding protein [Quadrisphaera granulorum]SZE98286.1 Winged helix DNA-binding domain-containing protein [Quadrisphaera granulorum]
MRTLEKKQLVTRRTDARDRRAVRVSATPAGAALARAATQDVEAADLAFFGPGHHEARSLVEHLALLDGTAGTDD